ncbi:MAG TPA: YceI family protein, partial [Xylella fastidiosa subsp. pauca]
MFKGAFLTVLTAAALVIGCCVVPPACATDYVQTSGSILVFSNKYDGKAFTGTFPGFYTQMSFDANDLAKTHLDVTIPLTYAQTGDKDRDATLQSADFFNVSKFATAHYQASKFRALGHDKYAADGTLELRGMTKPVTLTFTWRPGTQPVLNGKATVNRLDFG